MAAAAVGSALRLYSVGLNSSEAPLAALLAARDAADKARFTHTPLVWHHQQQQLDSGSIAGAPQPAAAIVAPPSPQGSSVPEQQEQLLACVAQLRAASSTLFIVAWHAAATEDALLRVAAFDSGANMLTFCSHTLERALRLVAQQQQEAPPFGPCACEWCGMPALSPRAYWTHLPLYHCNHANRTGVCQLCGRHARNLARHVHEAHDPTGAAPEDRTGVFALVIVRRRDGKFLMTQEFAGQGFWVPGGGANRGESLAEAAQRECREEAGVRVALRGILALESDRGGTWRRIIFHGEPLDEAAPPKTLPDFESAGAAWVGVDELPRLPLRSKNEPCTWFPALMSGKAAQLPLYNSLALPDEWARGAFAGWRVL